MQKYLLILGMMLLSSAVVACWHEEWTKSSQVDDLPHGKLVSIRYHTPTDSGALHLAFVSPDASGCFAGYRVDDRFPPVAQFAVQIDWKRCDSQVGSAIDSIIVRYDGDDHGVSIEDDSFAVPLNGLLLVIVVTPDSTEIHRVIGNEDVPQELDSETAAKLKSVLGSDAK